MMERMVAALKDGPMNATLLSLACGTTCKDRAYKTARDRLVEQKKIRCSSPTPAGKWELT
jgi:hypothetical protein